MINFFVKPSTVVVDCFTKRSGIYNLFKIDIAAKFVPEWFKNMPSTFNKPDSFVGELKVSTIKRCYGLTENFKSSFILPLWSDVVISTTEDRLGYVFSDGESVIEFHHNSQINNALKNQYHQIKFISPWLMSTKKNIKFLATSPVWNLFDYDGLSNKMIAPHGILNFKYQTNTNVNVLFVKQQERYELNAGMPLAQFFPLTEKKVKLKWNLVDESEYIKIWNQSGINCFFQNRIKKLRNIK